MRVEFIRVKVFVRRAAAFWTVKRTRHGNIHLESSIFSLSIFLISNKEDEVEKFSIDFNRTKLLITSNKFK